MVLALPLNQVADSCLCGLVLGLDNADAARKLVRLLLADPLGPRESWEDILEGYGSDPSRGLLIRYVTFC